MSVPITQYETYELLSAYDKLVGFQYDEKPQEEEPITHTIEDIRKEILRRMNLGIPQEGKESTASLKSVEHPKKEDGEITTLLDAKYKFVHNTPGRDGTSFDFDVSLQIDTTKYATHYPNGSPQETKPISITLEFGELKTKTIEDAFAKLSEWCARAATALHHAPKKFSFQLPF